MRYCSETHEGIVTWSGPTSSKERWPRFLRCATGLVALIWHPETRIYPIYPKTLLRWLVRFNEDSLGELEPPCRRARRPAAILKQMARRWSREANICNVEAICIQSINDKACRQAVYYQVAAFGLAHLPPHVSRWGRWTRRTNAYLSKLKHII